MKKIEEKAEAVGVTLDSDTHDDYATMMKSSIYQRIHFGSSS